jgi:hypothetical protein
MTPNKGVVSYRRGSTDNTAAYTVKYVRRAGTMEQKLWPTPDIGGSEGSLVITQERSF